MKSLRAAWIALVALAACLVAYLLSRSDGWARPGPAPADSSVAARGHAPAADADAPAPDGRCLPVGGTTFLAPPRAATVVVGDFAAGATSTAIGIVRTDADRMTQAIAIVPDDLSSVRTVDLGPSVGDAPPPRPFIQGDQLFAASYLGGGPATGAWRIGLVRVDADHASPLATFEQRSAESGGLDVAAGATGSLVAWNEDAPAGDRGLVKVAVFDGAHLTEPRVLSPDATDADDPRAAVRAGGYWVAWFGHRPILAPDAGLRDDLEGPAESRELRWVEVVATDDQGKAAGAVHRLPSGSVHVSAFTLLADPGSADELRVLVRDDEEMSEGAGGRILSVTVRSGGADAPVVVGQGAGRGAPGVARATPAWLSYMDVAEHTVLLTLPPVEPPGPGSAPASHPDPEAGAARGVEPALEGARILPRTRGKNGEVLAVFPGDRSPAGAAPVRAFRCER